VEPAKELLPESVSVPEPSVFAAFAATEAAPLIMVPLQACVRVSERSITRRPAPRPQDPTPAASFGEAVMSEDRILGYNPRAWSIISRGIRRRPRPTS
jgi:hypothetical protein